MVLEKNSEMHRRIVRREKQLRIIAKSEIASKTGFCLVFFDNFDLSIAPLFGNFASTSYDTRVLSMYEYYYYLLRQSKFSFDNIQKTHSLWVL
jgi:hypothetical protein